MGKRGVSTEFSLFQPNMDYNTGNSEGVISLGEDPCVTMSCYQDCKIILSNNQSKIHYVSEWDPRLPAHTKGGYLDGKIKIPQYDRPMKMTIQSWPAAGNGMEAALEAEVHPSIIHNVRMGRGRREQNKEPVPSDCHWRQQYLIRGDGSVSIMNQLSPFDADRNVPLEDQVTRVHDNTITLGKRNQELNLIIVQPKQRSRADAEEATVTKVISHRLQTKGIPYSSETLNKLEKCFKGAKFGKNMKQVKLKVDFTDHQTDELIAFNISEETIGDYTNKHIGPLDLADANPLKSCMQGGRKVIIVSEQNLPKGVEPMFQIWSGGIERTDLEKYITQPSDIQVRPDSIIFLTPPQLQLPSIDCKNLTLTLAVRRTEDGHISDKKFPFHYEHHNLDECYFCHGNLDTDEDVNHMPTKTGKVRRTQSNISHNGTTTVNVDLYSKIEELSAGSFSPSSGYISSPEYSLYEPPYKVKRQDTPEDFIPTTVSEVSTTKLTSLNEGVRTFGSENGSSPSTSSLDYENLISDYTPEDWKNFSNLADNLPPIFTSQWIQRDGGRASASPRDPTIRAELDVVSHALHMSDKTEATTKDYMSYLSRLVFFFFIFLFLQVLAFMFMYDEEEDIPLFEFSSSSILFSMTSILMES